MKRIAPLPCLFAAIVFIGSCGGSSKPKAPGASGLVARRVVASQSVSSPTASAGLVIINGDNDTVAHAAEINAGISPGLMTMSPDRSVLLAFDSVANGVNIINTSKETSSGSITLPGPTISMVATTPTSGYAAVPSAPFNTGPPPGAVIAMNLASATILATISVPNAQYVVASPTGSPLLAFSNESDSLTVISQPNVNTGNVVTTTVSGFDRPIWAVFSTDGSTAYVLNCGPECGSASATASVQTLDMSTLAVGAHVPVDGATIGWLSGSTLYVAGTPTASVSNSHPNNSCAGQATAAKICGRLDTIDVGTMMVTGSAVITDGYHDRIDMSVNSQLFVGSYNCTNIGDVNNPIGEVRGCLSIFNTTNGAVVIPPDNGDVTGFQSLTTQYVEYVAEGGNLRVYNTQIDSLLITNYIEAGTIVVPGQVIDVKAIDFF